MLSKYYISTHFYCNFLPKWPSDVHKRGINLVNGHLESIFQEMCNKLSTLTEKISTWPAENISCNLFKRTAKNFNSMFQCIPNHKLHILKWRVTERIYAAM